TAAMRSRSRPPRDGRPGCWSDWLDGRQQGAALRAFRRAAATEIVTACAAKAAKATTAATNTVADVPREEDSSGADEGNEPKSNTQNRLQGHLVPRHYKVEYIRKWNGQREHPSKTMRAVRTAKAKDEGNGREDHRCRDLETNRRETADQPRWTPQFAHCDHSGREPRQANGQLKNLQGPSIKDNGERCRQDEMER
ncbi:MAG: hypothetical protein ACYSUI_14030, partial [Planctomycetota bacterium]